MPNYQQTSWGNQPNNFPAPFGPIEAVKLCFQKFADFSGRAPRAEFWWWQLFLFVCTGVVSWISQYLSAVVGLVLLLPTLAVTWRRLHDIGKGGGWWFLSFIPIVGTIILIIWEIRPSEPRPNRFGPVPNY